MKKIRYGLIVLSMLLGAVTSATAELSISIGLPHVSIGINLPVYPELVRVPGYPVYYAPGLSSNYFFYDGMYWIYQDDNWYASSWYNGPWGFVEPEYVPLFILRVPVRYYRQHPVYFRGWRSNEPPRWGEHWGREWEHRRSGWDRWERRSAPAPAPLPVYQRRYSGDRYPRVEEQQALHRQKYRYQPRDAVVRQHSQRQLEHKAPEPARREIQKEPERRDPRPEGRRPSADRQDAPARPDAQTSKRGGERVQEAAPAQALREQRAPAREQRQQPVAAQPDRRAPTAQERGQVPQTREKPPKEKQSRREDRNKDEDKEGGRERHR